MSEQIAPRGKRIIAANPWPLAAEAKRLGLPTGDFQESDLVPDEKVYVIDLDALALPVWEGPRLSRDEQR